MIQIKKTNISDNFTELVKQDRNHELQLSPEIQNLKLVDHNIEISGNFLK